MKEIEKAPKQHFQLIHAGQLLDGGVNLIRRSNTGIVIENFCVFYVSDILDNQTSLVIAGIKGLDVKHLTTPPELHKVLLDGSVYNFEGTKIFLKMLRDDYPNRIKLKMRAPRDIQFLRNELLSD